MRTNHFAQLIGDMKDRVHALGAVRLLLNARYSMPSSLLRSNLADSLIATVWRRSLFHRIILRAASKVSAAWSIDIADENSRALR